jgi:hypothetical protein
VISSSTLEVGTGKSALASQLGEAWSDVMKELHNIDVPFTSNNIVWRPKELIDRALTLPKYSCIILDEWEDSHYWSALGMTLRQFFRKCRQLNLFIIIIIPNFFQLGIGYAISRSVCFIDVRFEEGFQRGYFSFYGYESKKKLYLLGKKYYNYKAAKADFIGRFNDGYGVPRDEYLTAKKRDIEMWDEDKPKRELRKEYLLPIILFLRKEGWSREKLYKVTKVTPRTINIWIEEELSKNGPAVNSQYDYNTNLIEDKS